jgi:hypothetical protein
MTKDAERFSVTVTVTKAIKGDHILYAYGLDERGWEVIWTALPKDWDAIFAALQSENGQYTVKGHEIYAYGGEVGAWGPSMPPARKEDQ